MLQLTTRDLIAKLKDENPEVRLMAVKYLGMRFEKESLDALLNLLNDDVPKIREQAIYSLGAVGDVDIIVEPLITMLNDPDISVRLAAIKVLGESGSDKCIKPLIKLLSSNNRDIKEAAVIALGQIRNKNALFPLIDMLDDEDVGVKVNAILALGQLGDERAIEPIIKKLNDEPAVKKMAAITLSKFKDERIIEPLIKVLQSKDPEVRQCAVYSLGMVPSPKIIDPMLKLLNDEDPIVRQATATALSNIKSEKIILSFIDKLRDTKVDATIRQTAARALGKLKDDRAIPVLLECLSDSNASIREECINSLGALGNVESIGKIIKYLKDKNENVRAAAAGAIGKIFSEKENLASIKEKFGNMMLIYSLKKRLKDKSLEVRIKTAEALAKIYAVQLMFDKASEYYFIASEEALTWDFRQQFYEGCAIGCKILYDMSVDNFKDQTDKFENLYDDLEGAAKLYGIERFVSEHFWRLVQKFNEMILSKNKRQFIKTFKELGMNLLILTKKLPENLQYLLEEPQEKINRMYQFIEKKGLALEEAKQEAKGVRDVIFDMLSKILQIEPLKIKAQDEVTTIEILENLDISYSDETKILDSSGMNEYTTKKLGAAPSVINASVDKDFVVEIFPFMRDYPIGDKYQVSIIQLHKGVRRLSLVEEDIKLWERFVKRYYSVHRFKNDRMYQFTKEAEIMRVKPKIIGFMDDAIFEGSSLVIFPELSVPYSYLEKLQGYADRFDLFIIAGIETIREGNKFSNRAYLIGPKADHMEFQEKNFKMVLKDKNIEKEWVENIQSVKPPLLKAFDTCMGRFIIFIGEDFFNLYDYIPFIVREYHLDFIVLLYTGILTESSFKLIEEMGDHIRIPIIFANTGLYGHSTVINGNNLDEVQLNYLHGEYRDGILNWIVDMNK